MRKLGLSVLFGFCLFVSVSTSSSVFAQDGGADSRATTFRAMQGPAHESVPGGTLMIAAYSLVWFFVFAYVARIGMLATKTAGEIERLSADLKKKSAATESGVESSANH